MMFAMRRGPYRRGDPARHAILEAVRTQPGSSRSDLRRLTGLSWGTVSHHVANLVASGRLREHRLGRRTYYSEEGPDPGLLPYIRMLRNEPEIMDLIRVLNRNGPFTVQYISDELSMGRKTVHRHLATLLRAGLVAASSLVRPKYELRAVPMALGAALREPRPG